jgi:translation initiation factor IF-3
LNKNKVLTKRKEGLAIAGPFFKRGSGKPQVKKDQQPAFRTNREIRVPSVRLVGDNISEPGVFPISEALKMAEEMELDLVEISPNADPPVCKIIEYQKFLYQQKKNRRRLKQKPLRLL